MYQRTLYTELARKARRAGDAEALRCMDDIDEYYQAGLLSVDQRGELWGMLIRSLRNEPAHAARQ